jgi:hypothetical protein
MPQSTGWNTNIMKVEKNTGIFKVFNIVILLVNFVFQREFCEWYKL